MSAQTEKQALLKQQLNNFDVDVYWEEEVDSTNNLSSQYALEGRENLVVAETQSAGLGRLGRSFISGRGGLYESLSVCLNDIFGEGQQPDLGLTLHFPLLAALGVMNAVQTVCGMQLGVDVIPDIKWPNDLQIAGKKFCGILCRAAQNHGKWFIIVGIGINVCNELPEELTDAATLKTLLADAPADTDWDAFIQMLAAEVFKEVYKNLKNGIKKSGELLDEVEAHCITIGKQVEVPERQIKGKAVQIGDDGSLCIKTSDGEYEVVKSGDVVIYGEA